MNKNKSVHKIINIEPEFESILVCSDRRLKPYIEILIQEPENITSQNLGKLIGVFEVQDDSEDSSYIVNYLISVIKKEYFSKPKRGPIESLESALHKANLALSGLAEHENIKWLGKLNVLIAVTERNNLHLSQTGTASAFLLRSKILTNVSEGLAPVGAEPNPMKTFVSVSSGRLEKDDKLIITTDSIFDIFSLEEIKKSASRFSDAEFIQFLRTALGSELQRAAVLVADLKNKEVVTQEVVKAPAREVNVFSNDAFINKQSVKKNTQEKIDTEIKREIKESSSEFTDTKTGHIYIKEDLGAPAQENNSVDYFGIIFEKLTDWSKNLAHVFAIVPWSKIQDLRLPKIPKINFNQIKKRFDSQPKDNNVSRQLTEKSVALAGLVKNSSAKNTRLLKNNFSLFLKNVLPQATNLLKNCFSQKNKETGRRLGKNIYHKLCYGLSLFTPSFEKIKKNTRKMDYQQRLYAILILVLIFVVPLIGLKIKDSFNPEKPILNVEAPPIIQPLAQDKNVIRIASLNPVYAGSQILKTINLNAKIFAITATEVFDLEKNKSFPIPQDFGTPKYATGMEDLNLLFLINSNNQIISFSPISSTFQNNNLVVPVGADIRAIGTYLTYIYLVDAKNNRIYRYPRADGGFGTSKNWLKDSINLSGTADMALGDNIFIANKDTILKLFRGQTQNFSLEQTATPINITAVALGEQSGAIFILDKQNARIIQLDTDGKIIAQYYNPEISSATSIAINENTKTIYIASESSIKTISIN